MQPVQQSNSVRFGPSGSTYELVSCTKTTGKSAFKNSPSEFSRCWWSVQARW